MDIDSVNIVDSKDGEVTVVNRATDSNTGVSDNADANVCDSICDVDDTSAADDDVDKKADLEVYVADVDEFEAADGIDWDRDDNVVFSTEFDDGRNMVSVLGKADVSIVNEADADNDNGVDNSFDVEPCVKTDSDEDSDNAVIHVIDSRDLDSVDGIDNDSDADIKEDSDADMGCDDESIADFDCDMVTGADSAIEKDTDDNLSGVKDFNVDWTVDLDINDDLEANVDTAIDFDDGTATDFDIGEGAATISDSEDIGDATADKHTVAFLDGDFEWDGDVTNVGDAIVIFVNSDTDPEGDFGMDDRVTAVSDKADVNACDSVCDDDTSTAKDAAANDDVHTTADSEVYVADADEVEAADGNDRDRDDDAVDIDRDSRTDDDGSDIGPETDVETDCDTNCDNVDDVDSEKFWENPTSCLCEKGANADIEVDDGAQPDAETNGDDENDANGVE